MFITAMMVMKQSLSKTIKKQHHLFQQFCINNKTKTYSCSFNENSGSFMGSIKMHNGRSYHVKSCDGGYILEEFDVQQFPDDQSIPFDGQVQNTDSHRVAFTGQGDTTTVVKTLL